MSQYLSMSGARTELFVFCRSFLKAQINIVIDYLTNGVDTLHNENKTLLFSEGVELDSMRL